RVASQHAGGQRLFHTLLHCRDVFARHHTALDFVHEFKALTCFQGLQREHHVTVLTLTTRLTNELAVHVLDGVAHGFAVCNLGLAHVGLHVELALHTVNDNFQVQLAHTGDDGLTRFFVGTHAEGWVFSSQ